MHEHKYESRHADGVDEETVAVDRKAREILIGQGKDPDNCSAAEYVAAAERAGYAAIAMANIHGLAAADAEAEAEVDLIGRTAEAFQRVNTGTPYVDAVVRANDLLQTAKRTESARSVVRSLMA